MPGSTPIDFVPGIGRRTAQVLHNMGVHTAGQLAHIPEGVLEHIFGPSIQAVLGLARTRKFPNNPIDFSSKSDVSTYVSQFNPQNMHAKIPAAHLSWWRKFQLAARVVSVL